MGHFEQTLQFMDDIKGAQTPEDVCARFLDVIADFGLTAFVADAVSELPDDEQKDPAPSCRQQEERLHPLKLGSDQGPALGDMWLPHDPVLRPDGEPRGRNGKGVDGEELESPGGLAFPLVAPSGKVVVIPLGREAAGLSPEELGMVSVLATYAARRAVALKARSTAERIDLTPRETECLRWAAAGKSEWEISQILGISEQTSEKHLLNAKSKLKAVNRVHAVAEAIRRGLIA